jgi:hypothetical protein
MKTVVLVVAVLLLFHFHFVVGQNPVAPQSARINIRAEKVLPDTTLSIRTDLKTPIGVPGNSSEYSIARYKNVDFLKVDPLQLELSGIHTEIYISNTQQGVIIISSAEPSNALTEFGKSLELHPDYYENLTRQDTLVFLPANTHIPVFDFMQSSSIRHEYKNAFNNTLDPRTGVSWSKGTHKDFLQNDILNKPVYDLIMVLPKVQEK